MFDFLKILNNSNKETYKGISGRFVIDNDILYLVTPSGERTEVYDIVTILDFLQETKISIKNISILSHFKEKWNFININRVWSSIERILRNFTVSKIGPTDNFVLEFKLYDKNYFSKKILKGCEILYNYNNLVYIVQDNNVISVISKLNLRIVTRGGILSNIFRLCDLGFVSIKLESIDARYARSMSELFRDCWYLQQVEFSNFELDNCIDVVNMFYNCRSLKYINLNSLNLSNVRLSNFMFFNCKELEFIDFSNVCFNRLENAASMFANCVKLCSLNFDKGFINIDNMRYYKGMFFNCFYINTEDYIKFKTVICNSSNVNLFDRTVREEYHR